MSLLDKERHFGDLLENVRLFAVMLDADARILYCNVFLLEVTGWAASEVLGKSWFDLFVPSDQPGRREAFAALLANSPEALHRESEILTRAGEPRLIRWNNAVLRGPDGAVVGTASIGEDVTDQRRTEREVRALNASLERRVAERTAELERANRELEAFDSSVTHDLRAPLRHIVGFSTHLMETAGPGLDEQARQDLQRIVRAGQRMDELITDLFDLSTISRSEMTLGDVDLTALAGAVLQALAAGSPERRVEVTVHPGMRVLADRGLMKLALENLIGNAWKFSRKRADAVIEVGSEVIDGRTAYFVRDNGAGFEMAYAGKLFEPFKRLHSAAEFEGSGVGLATVRRIVERHGGRVWADSVPGEYTVFHFTLAETAA